MAGVSEASGGEAKSAADERAAKLAREAGEEAASAAKELLTRHPNLIGARLVELITDREFRIAYRAAEVDRAEGRMNDNNSRAPGLTAFFTREGFEGLTEASKKEDAVPYLAGYVAEMQPVDPEGTMYSLRLPQGTYGMGMGGCQFYGEVTEGDGLTTRNDSREKPFSSPYNIIVRIEGDSGEVWQNANLQADGTPREK
jgi:hypothetical protein